MQILKRTFAAAAITFVAVAAQAQPKAPDLTGSWELNPAKSDFGPMAAQAPTKGSMTISMTGTSIKIEQSATTPQGDRTMNQEIPLTAKDTTWTAPDGQPVTSSYIVENGALVVNSKLQRQGMDITQSSRWTLSADGKTLTLVQQTQTPMGGGSVTIVFDKKS